MEVHVRRSFSSAGGLTLLLLLAAGMLGTGLAGPSQALAYSGQIQWTHTTISPDGTASISTAAAPGPNGTLYTAGETDGMGTTRDDVLMERLKQSLTLQTPVVWSTAWDNPLTKGLDRASHLVVDSKGRATAVGTTSSAGTSMDWLLVNRSPSGGVRWTATYDGGLQDVAQAAAVDGQGNVYVAGYATVQQGVSLNLVVRKFAASDGHPLWTFVYRGFTKPQRYNQAGGIAVDAAGNAYVAGTSEDSASSGRPLVLKLTPRGKLAWLRKIRNGTRTYEHAYQVQLVGGSVYVTASQGGPSGSHQLLLSRYTTGGRLLWTRAWAGLPNNNEVMMEDLTVDGLGNVIVAGADYLGDAQSKAFVASWSPSGKRRWLRTYWDGVAGARTTHFDAAAADAAGHVWVAGYTYPSSGATATSDALLLRLTPKGGISWVRSYDAGFDNSDGFNDIVLWGRNSLAAIGWSDSAIGQLQALAIKYQR